LVQQYRQLFYVLRREHEAFKAEATQAAADQVRTP
jgi:hypothetical protein